MNNYEAYWIWYDFTYIAGAAVHRQRQIDGDQFGTNWARQEQVMLMAALSLGCSMFEALGLKHHVPHNKVLSHLRNALIHNGGNIALNHGHPEPLNDCKQYIQSETWKSLFPLQSTPPKAFFEISTSNTVILKKNILHSVLLIFSSHMTPDERTRPGPQ